MYVLSPSAGAVCGGHRACESGSSSNQKCFGASRQTKQPLHVPKRDYDRENGEKRFSAAILPADYASASAPCTEMPFTEPGSIMSVTNTSAATSSGPQLIYTRTSSASPPCAGWSTAPRKVGRKVLVRRPFRRLSQRVISSPLRTWVARRAHRYRDPTLTGGGDARAARVDVPARRGSDTPAHRHANKEL